MGAADAAAAAPDAGSQDAGAEGVMMPPVSWPGACERVVLPMGGGDPLYTLTVDLSEAEIAAVAAAEMTSPPAPRHVSTETGADT